MISGEMREKERKYEMDKLILLNVARGNGCEELDIELKIHSQSKEDTIFWLQILKRALYAVYTSDALAHQTDFADGFEALGNAFVLLEQYGDALNCFMFSRHFQGAK